MAWKKLKDEDDFCVWCVRIQCFHLTPWTPHRQACCVVVFARPNQLFFFFHGASLFESRKEGLRRRREAKTVDNQVHSESNCFSSELREIKMGLLGWVPTSCVALWTHLALLKLLISVGTAGTPSMYMESERMEWMNAFWALSQSHHELPVCSHLHLGEKAGIRPLLQMSKWAVVLALHKAAWLVGMPRSIWPSLLMDYNLLTCYNLCVITKSILVSLS